MRMRKKKNTARRLEVCSDYILPKDSIITDKETVLEIGCGKGHFICQMAKQEPETLFIAMEKVPDVAMLAAESAMRDHLSNVRFIIADAKELKRYFPKPIISRIYLNFSDPWTRSGQFKRRLTYRSFLEIYKSVLKPTGSIFFKTDNRVLFDFSLDEFRFSGFETRQITYDLHNSKYASDNIITEYEKNFSSKGFPIHRVEAYLTPESFIMLTKAEHNMIKQIMPLFDDGREYFRLHDIPQWQNGYPSKEIIENDINNGNAYVFQFKGKIAGYCSLNIGNDPTYNYIENGNWKNTRPYAALHRVVIAEDYKGMGLLGRFIDYFSDLVLESGVYDLRADTHEMNRSMRHSLEKNGFELCGIIHLENGDPRVAYQKVLKL